MRTVEQTCNYCGNTFLADPREVNRGNAKYCNLSCSAKNRKRTEIFKMECINCGITYETKDTKSKYCNRICKQRYYRKTGKGDDNFSMRTYNRVFKDMGCEICGWNETITDLHHIKKVSDGGLNEMDNLIKVCPNHHRMIHNDLVPLAKLNEIVQNRKPILYNGEFFDGKRKTYN